MNPLGCGSTHRAHREATYDDMPGPGITSDFAGVLSMLDSTAALCNAAEVAFRDLGADLAAGAERIGEDDAIQVRALVGARTEGLAGLVVAPQAGIGGQAAVLRRTVIVADYCASRAISHDFDDLIRAEGLHAVMAAPIVRAHRLYGVLYAARRTAQRWSEQDGKDLLALARRTAIAMEVADSAREMASIAVYAERRDVAIRLHDSVGATLFSLRAALVSLRADLPAGQAAEQAAELEALAERATTELRTQTRALHEAPTDKALLVALQGDCRDFSARTGVAANVVVVGDLPPADAARCGALRSAAREALLNVEKHARADSVVLSVFGSEGGLGIALADDGRVDGGEIDGPGEGSGGGQPMGRRGLGLAATAERLERVGGWLSFAENDQGGGTVRAWVPAFTATPPAAP